MTPSFKPAVVPPAGLAPVSWWFLYRDDLLLVYETPAVVELPSVSDPSMLGLAVGKHHFLGSLDDRGCYAAEILPGSALPPTYALAGLRSIFGRVDEGLFAIAGRASQIVTWDRTHQFCGRCGTPTLVVEGERARRCPACGLTAYPRISPCVIVLITRDDEILLARGKNFPAGRYSTPAGFVEAGETLEETVVREIREEVGVEVKHIQYFGSQPWPYPHQMMIGFTCEWASGEIRIDPGEIADAKWFTRDTMPEIPPRMSISRELIEHYLDPTPRPYT